MAALVIPDLNHPNITGISQSRLEFLQERDIHARVAIGETQAFITGMRRDRFTQGVAFPRFRCFPGETSKLPPTNRGDVGRPFAEQVKLGFESCTFR